MEILKSMEGRDHHLGMQLETMLTPYIRTYPLWLRVSSLLVVQIALAQLQPIDLNARDDSSDTDNSHKLGKFRLRSSSPSQKLFSAPVPIKESLFRRSNLLHSHFQNMASWLVRWRTHYLLQDVVVCRPIIVSKLSSAYMSPVAGLQKLALSGRLAPGE